MEIQGHYAWEKIEDSVINIEYISTTVMAANSLTKLLRKTKWGHFVGDRRSRASSRESPSEYIAR